MKNKPTRHKESNTFKFQPFSERIASIDVDVFHRVGHEFETQFEEDECFFYQCIQKWNVLNLTESYAAFTKEIRPGELITLPQLIHNRQKVVEIVLKHLRNKNLLCLQPLLELVVALAKDLRKDFYPYYAEFFDVLLDLLNTKDVDQLEWTFTCLAYIFKFLWRPLTKDISIVFNSLLPLLSDDKPHYVNNFAAESFAYVVRKVKDCPAFLNYILKTVKREQDGISGCGRLLFEVIHGISGQFHSCADTFLPFLLDSLSNESLPQDTLFEVLENLVENIVLNIHPQNSALFWRSCTTTLEKLSQSWSLREETAMRVIENVLKLVGQATEYRSGKLLQSPLLFVPEFLKLFALQGVPESFLSIQVQIAVLLLLSKNIRLAQDEASLLIRKVLAIDNKNVILYFIKNVVSYTSFEAVILPSFLKLCTDCDLETASFCVLTELLLKKAPISGNGINLAKWSKYPLDFGTKQDNKKIENVLLKLITISVTDMSTILLDDYLCALICLPHLNLSDSHKLKEILNFNMKLLCEEIGKHSNSSCEDKLKKVLFTLLCTVECAVHVMDENSLIVHSEAIVDAVLPLSNEVSYLCSLNILDLYLTALKTDPAIVTFDMLKKLHGVLENNFNSPYHEVRLLSAHIYTLFEFLPDLKLDVENEDWNIFSICLQVESISPQVKTYREQLQQLEKFMFDKQQITICKNTEFSHIPLRYLCGVLYINFQLLWEPVSSLIASHAHGLEINKFWEVFVGELKSAVGHVQCTPSIESGSLSSRWSFLKQMYIKSYEIEQKPDFVNYRLLLWKSMVLFPEIVEAKTRDVSELFLKFIEDEYYKSNSDVALMWNIKQNSSELQNDTLDTTEPNVEEEIQKKEIVKSMSRSGGKNNLKALIQHLSLFTKIRSPKSMYREPELYKIYFELLAHRHHEVQKIAMDCIMTYKHKFLIPYQQNLYTLIDEKNFKNELAIFRVDKESSVVQEEHRAELIPIVLKIVLSKMFAKTGLRTGGKSSGQLRRNLVLRFLAGCHEQEMFSFVQMTFKFYLQYLEDDQEIMVENICKNLDLEKMIPPKRLQSTLNLLAVILEQFGGLMGNELLAFLLKIVFTIGATIKGVVLQATQIHSGYLNILRNLRTSCIKVIEKFFGHFENYPWTAKEINAVFTVFVWPYLDKLDIEGIHSPTSLLKLFVQWGTNPRYFSLLVKHYHGDTSQYVLPNIVKLLLNKKSHFSVCHLIMEMIEKLLSLEPDEEDIANKIPVDDLLPIEENILQHLKLNEKLNYGSCILLPHVHFVLEKIKRKLETKSKNVTQRELFILCRVSELVWESNISDSILQLLLPVVLKKCSLGAPEETVLRYTTTIHNLIQNVEEPLKHLKLLSPLFADVAFVSSRKILCQLLESICKKTEDEELKTMAQVISGVNAWDTKWLDQPDFQKRLDAFRQVQAMVESDNIDVQLGVLLLYNCYCVIKNESDLSLRETAAHCWKTVATSLLKKYDNTMKEKDYILNETLFAIIRKGIRSKNDDLRNESILLLGHLARESPASHIVLQDLNKLTNKVDVEVDFFENLTHLQLHRHVRALLKFGQVFRQEENAPSPRTLTQFVLPLASFYLCSEKYSSKNSLIDAAIDAIGTTCKLLPWHQYEGILKFYLDKLRQKVEFQKQLVKLTVAVLEAFHFDLSKAQLVKVEEDVILVTSSVAVIESREAESKENEEMPEEGDEDGVEVEQEEEVLEGIKVDEEEDHDEEEEVDNDTRELKACDKTRILCKSTASRVIKTIQFVLLPQLHRALAEMTHHESSHKVNRKRTGAEREEENLLRVPISLAVVKLLQKLPQNILETNLPGVFMKICTFLKSQLESVRRVTRETLQKIMDTLGPPYLGLLLGEMMPLLNRGFQVHVLAFTVHAVLVSLKEKYQIGDIDNILLTLLDLCKTDLFGSVSEEKEVVKIGRKISEAKSTKSLDILQILAQFITDKCLMDLVLPIKQVLTTSHSFKIVHRAQECLRQIALGLVENKFIPTESLLKFAYGVASQSIPEFLASKQKPVLSEKERQSLERQKPDCFIIPAAPVGRSGVRITGVKFSIRTNSHILVEFGLRLCHFLLKRDKLNSGEFRPFVDPFVAVFKNCLNSKHVKLSTLTLQCLSWLMKYDLPSMKENVKDITDSMFEILHKYASAGLSKGDNFDLVVAAFKAMSVLVRDVKYHTIETDQLKILLLYAEQDLHDHDRQATAFTLLKAIVARKLITPEIHDVMAKVAELSIISELPHVRLQSRLVFHQFLVDYPLGKKVDDHLRFFISQLNYELQTGRESALEMIQMMIHSFPNGILKEHSGMLFITLGARLVNDEVPECRKMVATCLTSMLTRLERPDRDPLFDIIILWLQDKKISHKRLAAQLCGLLVTVEKALFETRLQQLTPVILTQFGLGDENKPGRYVLLKPENHEEEVDAKERVKDHHLFQVLQMLQKICAHCQLFLKPSEDLEILAKHVQTLLAYPHEWVRLAAAQFLGFVLASLNIHHLADLLATSKADEVGYLCSAPATDVKSLTLDLCAQLEPGSIKSDLAEQVIKNLVFLARVLQKVPMAESQPDGKINLLWLTKRMRKIVNTEVVETPTSIVLRTEVFKWIAGIGTVLELENILPVFHHLLAPLVREMITTEESNAPLRQLSKEVGKMFKKRVGMEQYTNTLSKLQQHLAVRRAERKRERTQLAVTDPEMFAKKKIKKNEKKKESKKRKVGQQKGGGKKAKRRKVAEVDDDSEIM